MLSRLPIRIRLTLVFAGVIALVLAGTGSFVYVRVGSSLSHALNQDLRARADDVGALAGRPGSGDPREFAGSEGVAQLIGPDGRVLRATAQLDRRPLLSPAELAQAHQHTIIVERPRLPGFGEGRWRLLATPAQDRAGPAVAVVAASLEPREEALHHLLVQLLLGGAGALLLASLAGYALAAAALRPVEAMSRTAAAISLRGDIERLPVPETRDEIAKLGGRLNEMLARIEAAFTHERRFLADASHELRTPLAILKTELELALRRPRSREELEEVLRSAQEETDRLAQLADDLLIVARADQGALPVRLSPSPAQEILHGVAERFDERAQEAGRRIVTRSPVGLEVLCDPIRVGQALANLVDNALHHGDGEITIAALDANGRVEFHVSDSGQGFPPSFLSRAFERFSRADEGRSGDGSGLGLAIVEAIAQAHGGSASAENRRGGGSDVWLTLPKEPV
jgi:two-component system OmpR family sensor kinase